VASRLLVNGQLECCQERLVLDSLGRGGGFGGVSRACCLALLLGEGFPVGLLRSSFGGLGFIAEDQIKLVLVAWTLSPRFGTLVACRLGLVAL
jgi:hypothetical protein